MFNLNICATINLQRPNSKKECAIRIRTIIKRHVTYYPTGVKVRKEEWNGKEVIVHPKRSYYNTIIRNELSKIENQYLEQSVRGETVTRIKKNNDPTFKEYAEKFIKDQTGVLSSGRTEQQWVYYRKFIDFNSTIKIRDVNKDTLIAFESYCRNRGNIENTVHSNTSFVKSVLNAALEDGLINRSPGNGFKGAKYTDPMRKSVTLDEIKLFEEFAENEKHNKTLRSVASWFLLGVWTGIRYGDMKTFQGMEENKITFLNEKTQTIVSIHSTEQIKKAYSRIDKGIFSNQKCNGYLKAIAVILNINKNLTMHVARHTFARLFIENGGRTEMLSRILGHSSIKHTAIYTKISDVDADAEMKKVFG